MSKRDAEKRRIRRGAKRQANVELACLEESRTTAEFGAIDKEVTLTDPIGSLDTVDKFDDFVQIVISNKENLIHYVSNTVYMYFK